LAAGLKAFVGALASYVGKQRTEFSPQLSYAQIPLDSYTTLDLRLGVRCTQ